MIDALDGAWCPSCLKHVCLAPDGCCGACGTYATSREVSPSVDTGWVGVEWVVREVELATEAECVAVASVERLKRPYPFGMLLDISGTPTGRWCLRMAKPAREKDRPGLFRAWMSGA